MTFNIVDVIKANVPPNVVYTVRMKTNKNSRYQRACMIIDTNEQNLIYRWEIFFTVKSKFVSSLDDNEGFDMERDEKFRNMFSLDTDEVVIHGIERLYNLICRSTMYYEYFRCCYCSNWYTLFKVCLLMLLILAQMYVFV